MSEQRFVACLVAGTLVEDLPGGVPSEEDLSEVPLQVWDVAGTNKQVVGYAALSDDGKLYVSPFTDDLHCMTGLMSLTTSQIIGAVIEAQKYLCELKYYGPVRVFLVLCEDSEE